MIRLSFLILWVGCFVGCSTSSLYRATTSGAVVASGAYRALDTYDAAKVAKIKELATTGKPDAAKAELDSYLPKYKKARASLDLLTVAIEGAADMLRAKVAGKGLASAAIVSISGSIAAVVSACAELGLKIPGALK